MEPVQAGAADGVEEPRWKYQRILKAGDFLARLPPRDERDDQDDQRGMLYLYRTSPLWYPGWIARLDETFDIADIRKSFGGGKYLLKLKWGRNGLTTRVLRCYGPPVICEQEAIAQERVHQYLKDLSNSPKYFQHTHWVSSRIAHSTHWLRALLRRLDFNLRRERPRPDGRRYWFPLIDQEPNAVEQRSQKAQAAEQTPSESLPE